MNIMKPAIVFFLIFSISVAISCTTQRNSGLSLELRHKKNDPPKFLPPVLPIEKKPDNKIKRDTVHKNTVQIIKTLDTAALIEWFKKMQLIENDDHVYNTNYAAILTQYRKALDQNRLLLNELTSVKQNKHKSDTKIEVAENALFDVPTYMYCILVLSIILIVIRQQYLKTKLENKINEIRAGR